MTLSYRRGFEVESDGSGTSIAGAYSSNTLGDLLWIGVGWLDPTGVIDVSTVVDSAGNTWQAAGLKIRNATEQYSVRLYRVPTGAKSSSGNTVTVTLSGATTFKRLAGEEWKSSNGPVTTDLLDQTASGTGSGTALATGNMTPTTNNQLVVAFCGNNGGTISVVSPFSIHQPSGGGSSTAAVDRVLSGGSGVATNVQATASSFGDWVITGATFKDVVSTPIAGAAATRTATRVPSAAPSRGKGRPLMVGGM